MTAKLPNVNELISAGINPKTGLPFRYVGPDDPKTKEGIRHFLRIIDEQDAVNRYKWYNLPDGLSSQELERLLYYNAQLCFFYDKVLDKFYFMPYALDGTIDYYGRFNTVHPIPMTAGTDGENKAQTELLSKLKLKVQYSMMVDEDDITEDVLTGSCVILRVYTNQLSQTSMARCELNEPILDVMSDLVPYMRTCLLAGTGIKGMRVPDADARDEVFNASRDIKNSALKGELFTPIVSATDFQDLTNGSVTPSAEFMLAMQSLDNLRLSAYGLENGGLFEKKAHMLNAEEEINNANIGLVMQDGLSLRQNFCNIVNSIWRLGIWCEPSETEIGQDADGDGVAYDENESGEHSPATVSQEGE